MSDFSVYSCYAALSACGADTPLYAFLEMVVALVDKKKYKELDPQVMVDDFHNEFKFKLPYHPMQTIIQLGINKGFFEYNSSLKKAFPVWRCIDSGEFMRVCSQKNAEYKELLHAFGAFLEEHHNLHCSEEELSEKVQAFIQRYGLISKVDRGILSRVKTDYHFAEYLIHCNTVGDTALLEYIDDYITGCAFEELLAFSEPTEAYKPCKAKVYLDTGFIFALLGIESKDRSKSFSDLLGDMVRLGMQPYIFEHTYSEISNIIDTACQWIGNPNYDPSIASETAYYFVTNNWSKQKATELLGDLKEIITKEYQIKIDDTSYPNSVDIRTKHQEDIKQMIVAQYTLNNPHFSAKQKDYTIEQDSRSLFMALHFNGDYIAHTLSDVKTIFITTNRTLARVGRKLTAEFAQDAKAHIPIALNDLAWGTLIWSNTPAKISTFNKASIISAAYAAFQPSDAMLKKLNKTLIECQKSGKISPEKCYFLKSNALAMRVLVQKTQNDEDQYTEELPFEILKELKREGFQEGLDEKQKVVDQLVADLEAEKIQQRIDFQKNLVRSLEEKKAAVKDLLESERGKQEILNQQLKDAKAIKEKATQKAACRCNLFRWGLAIISLACGVAAFFMATSEKYALLYAGLAAVVPFIAITLITLIKSEITSLNIIKAATKLITDRVYSEYGFDPEKFSGLNEGYEKQCKRVQELEKELRGISTELRTESAKVDRFSVDISVVADV